MSQTTGEEMLNRINATLGVLQDAQEKAVEAVRDVATHKADPNAHGEIIAAAVEAAVNEALGGTSGGGGNTGEDGEDGGAGLVDRLAALEGRFDESGKVLAEHLPLTDALDSDTGKLAASDAAVAALNAKISGGSAVSAPYNSRVVITESNAAWPSPVTGWAQITLIGGGGGGCGGGGDQYTACSGGSGGGGERKVVYVYLTEGSTYACTIGAGGAGGVSNKTGNPIPVDATLGKAGGATKFVAGSVTHSAAGGGGGGTKTSFGFAATGTPGGGGVTQGIGGIRGVLNTGVGGSYVTQFPSGQVIYGWGIGGLGGQGANPDVGHAIANGVVGVQGAIIIDYYDPKKETA